MCFFFLLFLIDHFLAFLKVHSFSHFMFFFLNILNDNFSYLKFKTNSFLGNFEFNFIEKDNFMMPNFLKLNYLFLLYFILLLVEYLKQDESHLSFLFLNEL